MRTNFYCLIILVSIFSVSCSTQWITHQDDIYNSNKGKVGIGTLNPDAKLTVVDSSTTISMEFQHGISSTVYYLNNASAIYGHASNSRAGRQYGGYFVSEAAQGAGVFGVSNYPASNGTGGLFHSYGKEGIGVMGIAFSNSDNPNYGGWFKAHGKQGVGIRAIGGENGYAAMLLGKTKTESLEIYGGADLSEKFKIRDYLEVTPERGMLVCIDPSNCGDLLISNEAYDKKIAGIISGAGDLKPGLILNQDSHSIDMDIPVALAGRVYCLVDASYGAVNTGDLLTSSETPGYAMKVEDYTKAQGAILGKAMSPLKEGKGLVLVLVTLQ